MSDYPPPPPPGSWGGPPPGAYPPPPGGSYPPPPGGGYGGYPPPPNYPPPGPGYGYNPAATPYGLLAGWGRRVLATVVDGFIIGIPLGIILVVAGLGGYGLSAVDQLAFMVYWALLIGSSSGQTIGNKAATTRVVDANGGGPIGPSRALIRGVVQAVLNLTFIGGILDFLWPLWDVRNQTLHDKAANSIVVMA